MNPQHPFYYPTSSIAGLNGLYTPGVQFSYSGPLLPSVSVVQPVATGVYPPYLPFTHLAMLQGRQAYHPVVEKMIQQANEVYKGKRETHTHNYSHRDSHSRKRHVEKERESRDKKVMKIRRARTYQVHDENRRRYNEKKNNGFSIITDSISSEKPFKNFRPTSTVFYQTLDSKVPRKVDLRNLNNMKDKQKEKHEEENARMEQESRLEEIEDENAAMVQEKVEKNRNYSPEEIPSNKIVPEDYPQKTRNRYYDNYQICDFCYKEGHTFSTCNDRFKRMCQFCLDFHQREECLATSCFNCNQSGHKISNCPHPKPSRSNWTRCGLCNSRSPYHATQECQIFKLPSKWSSEDFLSVKCLHCGNEGHNNCELEVPDGEWADDVFSSIPPELVEEHEGGPDSDIYLGQREGVGFGYASPTETEELYAGISVDQNEIEKLSKSFWQEDPLNEADEGPKLYTPQESYSKQESNIVEELKDDD